MHRNSCKSTLSAIDLFAGGGGLTVGLKRAGFGVIAAVEIEPHAFTTYKTNHPEVQSFKQDIRTIKGTSLKNLIPKGRIDLLAGCPPCQGFSSLTSKYKRDDPRNNLVLEMGRLIKELLPKAIMMENVPGLTNKGKPLLDRFIRILEGLGYVISQQILQVADYGVPQSRRRFVLLAGKGFKICIPKPTHSRSDSNKLLPWKTIRDVISNMPEPIHLEEANKRGGPQAFNWHVIRDMSSLNLRRLHYAIPGRGRALIPKHFRPQCHKNTSVGFGNVYGRMSWDSVSPTITAGCTTLSKGRFGHPKEERTISVREAALIQTFPKDYVIDTRYMDYACSIVGNALPCDFAEVLAKQCAKALVPEIRRPGTPPCPKG